MGREWVCACSFTWALALPDLHEALKQMHSSPHLWYP